MRGVGDGQRRPDARLERVAVGGPQRVQQAAEGLVAERRTPRVEQRLRGHARGLGVVAGHEQRGQANAGGRVALAGLAHEGRLRQAGCLRPDGVEQPCRGHDHG
ncbi:MAG: hypothetical protein ACK559_29695, partial [bacterium]